MTVYSAIGEGNTWTFSSSRFWDWCIFWLSNISAKISKAAKVIFIGVSRYLVVGLYIQWTSFTAKSEFQTMTTGDGFHLKSGCKKIWWPLDMVLALILDSRKYDVRKRNVLSVVVWCGVCGAGVCSIVIISGRVVVVISVASLRGLSAGQIISSSCTMCCISSSRIPMCCIYHVITPHSRN